MSINLTLVLSQLLIGALNGAFYAVLSLGLAIIFGLLGVVNFLHGAMYMLGAFFAWLLFDTLGVPFWPALVLAPLIVGMLAIPVEQIFLRRLYAVDHLPGLLVTFGLALTSIAVVRVLFGASGKPYPNPLPGAVNLGFAFIPTYRLFAFFAALVICLLAWLAIEKTKLGANLRAASQDPETTQALGVNVPLLRTLTYAGGAALAAAAGVLAAPIYQVYPAMGDSLLIIVFAVVVIGGMGSISGAILVGLSLGLVEAVIKMNYGPAANLTVFILMIAVLIFRPTGLFPK